MSSTGPATDIAAGAADDSLAERRREIRRRRRREGRVLLTGASWGAVTLVVGWLLFSGVFGLPNG